jgi:hypothetical protein
VINCIYIKPKLEVQTFSKSHPYKQKFLTWWNNSQIFYGVQLYRFATCNTWNLWGHDMINFWSAGRVVWLWAVWSAASTQTVQRPTVALPSVFWRHWIHSLPKVHTATGTLIAVGLAVDSYSETDNGARIYFWNARAVVSTVSCAGLRRLSCIIILLAWNLRSSRFAKNNVLLDYKHKRPTEKTLELCSKGKSLISNYN